MSVAAKLAGGRPCGVSGRAQCAARNLSTSGVSGRGELDADFPGAAGCPDSPQPASAAAVATTTAQHSRRRSIRLPWPAYLPARSVGQSFVITTSRSPLSGKVSRTPRSIAARVASREHPVVVGAAKKLRGGMRATATPRLGITVISRCRDPGLTERIPGVETGAGRIASAFGRIGYVRIPRRVRLSLTRDGNRLPSINDYQRRNHHEFSQ